MTEPLDLDAIQAACDAAEPPTVCPECGGELFIHSIGCSFAHQLREASRPLENNWRTWLPALVARVRELEAIHDDDFRRTAEAEREACAREVEIMCVDYHSPIQPCSCAEAASAIRSRKP